MPTPTAAPVRAATFAVWLLAAASLAYWGLRLGARPAPLVPAAGAPGAPPVDPLAVARFLGETAPAAGPAAAAAPSLASRFALVGVVAGARSGGGAAILSVDGQPARTVRVGALVEEGLVLQSVQGRTAVIADRASGAPVLTLELPPLRK